MSFDGSDDYVDVGTMGNFGSTYLAASTTSLWIKSDVTDASMTILGTANDGANTNYNLTLNANSNGSLSAGSIRSFIRDEDGSKLVGAVDTDTGITDGAWHHLVMVIKKAEGKLEFYVDGQPQTVTHTYEYTGTNFADFEYPLVLGAGNGRGTIGEHLQGMLDDVRIFDNALTAAQIQQLYDDGIGPDPNSPTPDPLVWTLEPNAINISEIEMTAVTAVDDLYNVEYYFNNVTDPNHDSGWQSSTYYKDTDLDPDTQYTYQVKARDTSPNNNETAYSTQEPATTYPPDLTPPEPDPLVWASEPNAIGGTRIEMTATTATDDYYDVQYYFSNLTVPDHNSGWQSETYYVDTGLDPNTEYTYQVKARDLSENLNETAYSTAESATTDDIDPNLVSHWAFNNGSGLTAFDSVGDKHGTLVDGPTWTTGQIGGALHFDGVYDYVALPDNDPIWLPANNFTISVWAYFEREPYNSDDPIFDLNWADSIDSIDEVGCLISRENVSGTRKLKFGMTTTSNSDDDLISSTVLVKDTWYHIVAVRDGTTQSIYIDGQLDSSRTCSSSPIDFVGNYDDNKVNIGKSELDEMPPISMYLKGVIDDLRLYDRALQSAEILQLYQDGL